MAHDLHHVVNGLDPANQQAGTGRDDQQAHHSAHSALDHLDRALLLQHKANQRNSAQKKAG